jgi:hypothetical protein
MITADNHVLVDFMILGAMKCGTTTLANILANHPDVCFSERKEPDFFAEAQDWRKEMPEYEKLFTNRQAKFFAEASTSYTSFPEYNLKIWDDLYEYNPNLKFIYLMRNPVSRMTSHFMHLYLRAKTKGSIAQAIQELPTMVNRGRYYTQILPYIEKFGRDKVYLLTFEEFLKDKETHLRKISEFLGLDFSRFTNYEDVHANQSVGGMKRNYQIQLMLEKPIFKSIEKVAPKFVWQKFTNGLYYITRKKVEERPEITAEATQMTLQLLRTDLIEMEKLMGRHLTEWKLPYQADLKKESL